MKRPSVLLTAFFVVLTSHQAIIFHLKHFVVNQETDGIKHLRLFKVTAFGEDYIHRQHFFTQHTPHPILYGIVRNTMLLFQTHVAMTTSLTAFLVEIAQ